MTVRPHWAGPSQLPEGVTVVTTRARWDAVRAAWEEPLRAKVGDPSIDWAHEVVLVLGGAQTSELGRTLRVAGLTRRGDRLALDVVFEGAGASVSSPNHPGAVVSAPATAFAGDPKVQLTWDGKPWPAPVRFER